MDRIDDDQFRHALGWPTRPFTPPTDQELGAVLRQVIRDRLARHAAGEPVGKLETDLVNALDRR